MKKLILLFVILTTLLLLIVPPLIRDVYLLSFLIMISMYTMISAGWNIIGGFTGYNSFGHGVFFGIGAYTTALVVNFFGMHLLAIPLSGLVAAMFAVVTGYPCLRLRGIYFSLSTVPVNYIMMLLVILLPFTGGPEGIMLKPLFNFDPLTNGIILYELHVIATLATIIFTYKILHSKIGIGLISIREDEVTAVTYGVPVTKLKLLAYAMSAIPAAISGGLYSIYAIYIHPSVVFAFGLSLSTIGIMYLGGRGTVLGAILGSAIFVFFSETLRYTLGIAVEGLNMFLFGIILVFLILFAPAGVMGEISKRFKHRA